MDFTGSILEGYDQNLLANLGILTSSPLLVQPGAYTNLEGDMRVVRRGSRLQLAGTGGMSARYYPGIGEFVAADYHAGFGASGRTSPYTTIEVNQELSYSPVFLLGLFVDARPPLLGEARASATDYALTDDRSLTSGTSVEVERRLSDRALALATGSYRRSHYLATNPNGTDFTTLEGGGLYRYQLTEDHDLELGYIYRRAQYSGDESFLPRPQPDEHIVAAGIAFHPTLSESRPTVLTVEIGTAVVHAPTAILGFQLGRQIRIVGEASVLHQMTRTWVLEGAFKRGTGFVEGLSAPVFADAFTVSANGFVNRRTDVLASFAYSNGEPSLVGSVTTFSSATANARVRVALSSRWAFTAEYLFYFYDFTDTPALVPGFSHVKRNSIQAGLALWLPIFRP